MSRPTVRERLLANRKIDPETGCWIFTGKWVKKGYGQMSVNQRTRSTHSLSYEEFVGPVPEGLELDHTCERTLCFAPHHLEPVTHRTNVLRGKGQAAINARKTHCDAGHDFSDPEVLGTNGIHRYCKICNRLRRGESNDRLASRPICAKGHDRTDPANAAPGGGCRVCNRDKAAAYRARKRTAAPVSEETEAAA